MTRQRSVRPHWFLGLAATVTAVGLVASAWMGSASASSSSSSTAAAPSPRDPVTLTMWSALSGVNGAAFNDLVNEFNATKTGYRVVADYKGSYSTTLADTIAAVKAHAAPDISMIFDAGTSTIMDAAGAYDPVHKLMAQYKLPFATSDFVGGAASYYETSTDQLDSLPFNSSTPVLYYNKTELSNAGISSPPKTWSQIQADAATLAAHSQKCALTSSGAYVMWTDLEQFALWNGYHYATDDNGYTAIKGVKLKIDTAPFIAHLALLGKLAAKGGYIWDGVTTSTVPLFTDGTCAMYEQSSADMATIQAGAKFPFGVSELPIQSASRGAQNTVVGGASLWALSGQPSDVYRGDAEFLHFLMSAKTQAFWASHTGYIPVTKAGSALLKSQKFYVTHPNDLVAVNELTNKPAKPFTRGIRLGYLPEIRQDEASAIASVLSGKVTAGKALATAQSQGDAILAEFAAQYGH